MFCLKIKNLFLINLLCFLIACNTKNEEIENYNFLTNNTLDNFTDSVYKAGKEISEKDRIDEIVSLYHYSLRKMKEEKYFTGIIYMKFLFCEHYFAVQRNDSCAYYGEQVLQMTEGKTLKEADLKIKMQTLSRLAILYINTGNPSISYRYYFQIQELAKTINDLEIQLDVADRLAYAFYRLQQFNEAIYYYNLRLELCRKIEKQKKNIMFIQGIYRDLGLTHYQLKNYEKAIAYYDTAIWLYKDTIPPFEKDKISFRKAIGIIEGNKGQALFKLKRFEEAEEMLKRNIEKNLYMPYGDHVDALSSLIALGNLYLQIGRKEHYLKLMKTVDSVYAITRANIYYPRILKLKALGFEKYRPDKDNTYQLEKFIELNDSINAAVLKYNLENNLIKKDVIKWREEIENLNYKTQSSKKLFYVTVTAALLLLISLVITILFVRNLRKNNQLLRELNEKVERSKTELEIQNQKLQKLMDEKNNIISIVAHDLRSPLNSILGISRLLQTENNSKEEEETLLKYLETSATHMNTVTEDLVEISQLENNADTLIKEEVNLLNLLNSTAELFKLKANEKKIMMTVEADNSQFVMLNEKKMKRALGNLLSNAIKFSNIGGQIFVFGRKEGGMIQIIVKDNGIGIDEKNLTLIFNRFTSAKKQGTTGEKPIGLGLSIVKQIVEKHNGTVYAKSNENEGAEFIIELPV